MGAEDGTRARIQETLMGLFDRPDMQNNLRALWIEAVVAEALEPDWEHCGLDWNPWDYQNSKNQKIELRQSARQQSWGRSTTPPRYDIAARPGTLIGGRRSTKEIPRRAADIYVFAWHDGTDQRDESEWEFFAVRAADLPKGQKSISLNRLRNLATLARFDELRQVVGQLSQGMSDHTEI